MSVEERKSSVEAMPTLSTMTTTVTLPEKTALSKETTFCTTPTRSRRNSTSSTPGLDKHANPFESDIETGHMGNASTDRIACSQRGIPLSRKSDCRVWPGRDHWKQKAKAAKQKRSWCGCLARLNRRNRIIAKVLIIILIIGIGVGVGFGISKPLGAPIWGKPHRGD